MVHERAYRNERFREVGSRLASTGDFVRRFKFGQQYQMGSIFGKAKSGTFRKFNWSFPSTPGSQEEEIRRYREKKSNNHRVSRSSA